MFFFFNDTATTEIYTLSLHDALPISGLGDHEELVVVSLGGVDPHGGDVDAGDLELGRRPAAVVLGAGVGGGEDVGDRKSTRLNSSHANISYAVFCLKKKKKCKRTWT